MTELATSIEPSALATRVRHLVGNGRLSVARPLFDALRRLAPPAVDLACLETKLLLAEGRPEMALAMLDQAIARTAGSASLHKARAEIRMKLDDPAGAAADAADAVILDPADPEAKALLGIVLIDLDRGADALACLQESVAALPDNAAAAIALARAYEIEGQESAAAAALAAAIARMPAGIDLRNAAALLAMRQRDFTGAVALTEAARQAGIADACAFGLQGHALSSLGRHDAAAEAYREALKLGPHDSYVRHLVAAAGALPGYDRAPDTYVRAVFDGYANRFEAHLISLGYRVPGLLYAMVRRLVPPDPVGRPVGPVLDLGCGTGLVGLVAAELPVGPWVGVDLSPAMLAVARQKGLYAELHEAELLGWLGRDERRWPLILAADVLCYFGALETVLARVHERLTPGGLFLFSLETRLADVGGAADGTADYALGRLGRYGHDCDYVERAARGAGFVIRAFAEEEQRREMGVPVPGLLVVLERVRHDG